MRMITRIAMVVGMVAAAALAACGGGDDDGMTVVDSGGVTVDGGGNVGYAGCTTFTDLTAAGATRTINAVDTTLMWNPKCIKIKAGQSVTWTFTSDHPLSGASGNPGSEIVAKAVGPATYTLNGIGVYGYFCQNHGVANGGGMAGAIQVVP